MANYGSNNTVIELADGSDVLQDISADVRQINGIDIEAMTQESHGFSKTWAEHKATGMSKIADVVISGFYDDAANKPRALFTRGASRRLKVTYGGGHSDLVTGIMVKFVPGVKLGALTEFSMTLRPSGAPTQA